MKGTRGAPPPDGAAENWSRRDGIRAGAVSGPWRSGPRGDAAPARPEAAARQAAGRKPTPPGRPVKVPEHVAVEEPERQAEPAIAAGPVRRQSRGGLVGWVVFGVLLAGAIVATSVVLRPQMPAFTAALLDAPPAADAEADAPRAPAPAEAPSAQPAVAPAPAETISAIAGPVRVRIGSGAAPERREAVVVALAAAGVAPVAVETMPFRVASSRVGYFRAEDRAAAGALANLVEPEAGAFPVSDYGALIPDAEPGRLDLWIGD